MAKADGPILTQEQFEEYEELGFVHSIPILSEPEVAYYRAEVEKTCQAIGSSVTRLDNIHFFFRWAWDLSTHPRLLDCLEQLLGPDIVLKSTRLFYKYGRSNSYVGWHQDGVTERLEDGRSPAVWLGLTAATVENGCLRVVPRSHRQGFLQHEARPIQDTFAGNTNLVQQQLRSRARVDELSGKITIVPPDANEPFDLVMRPGEMSIHHPVILHGSNANLSSEPRIGLSASYSTPELFHGTAAVWPRGDGPRDHFDFEVIDQPPAASLDEAVAAYRASNFQILFARM
jgi:ectoine hydroxylase-related dioxygenase (phytanoyl-CoA dioxygenase family)